MRSILPLVSVIWFVGDLIGAASGLMPITGIEILQGNPRATPCDTGRLDVVFVPARSRGAIVGRKRERQVARSVRRAEGT